MSTFTTVSAVTAFVLSLINFALGLHDRRTATKRIQEATVRSVRMENRKRLDAVLRTARKMVLDLKKDVGPAVGPPPSTFREPDEDEIAAVSGAFAIFSPRANPDLASSKILLVHPPLYRLGRDWRRAWHAHQQLGQPGGSGEWEEASSALRNRLNGCLEDIDSLDDWLAGMGDAPR
ncbi:hypothetical protein P3H80_12305 [Mycolicibacterium septicum]|uniref:hypothetical protein n=1 Tax=Mycolicibacterium septicum TaxID=98668 RepID=UPI0023E28F92|nr:hypothetical protein [Mycolicibacterium septicum]MDF3338210.1 hypothetical protein [Mycolicibacterium septicum]